MGELILQVGVPFSFLIISIFAFFIKKTLTTIEATQIELRNSYNSIHTDFQVSKSEFNAVRENLLRTTKIVERNSSSIHDLNNRAFNHGHNIKQNENNIAGFILAAKEETKRIIEIEKDLISIKTKGI
jgi:hypothetical protein